MRLVCPEANNIYKTDDIPNPLNIQGSMYVSLLHVDKWDQPNNIMSYAKWTIGFTLAMVDHNYHIYPNVVLSSKEYVRWDIQRFAMLYIFMTHDE